MKIAILSPFRLGVGYVRDAVCLLGQLYLWVLVFSDYKQHPININLVVWNMRVC